MTELERAFAYVAKIPAAVAGSGGHDQTFKALAAIQRNFDLDDSAFQQVADAYNAICSPPWSTRDLAHKIKDVRARVACESKPDEKPPSPAAHEKKPNYWPTREVAQAEFPKLPRAKNNQVVLDLMLRDYGLEPEMIPPEWRVITYKAHLGVVYPGVGPSGKVCCLRYKPVERDEHHKRHPSFFLYYAGAGVIENLSTVNGATPIVVTGGEEKAIAVREAGFGVLSTMTGEGSLSVEWTKALVDRDATVILAHDKDAPDETGKSKGQWANNRIGAMLLEAGLAADKILEVQWPADLKDGGDLNDILKDQGVTGLKLLLGSAKQWQPPESAVTEKTGTPGAADIEIGEDHSMFDKKGAVIPLHIVRKISAMHPNLVFVEDSFWDFTGKIYEELDRRVIGRETIALIGSKVRVTHIREVCGLLEHELPGDPEFFQSSERQIAVLNGVLDLESRTLIPHSPDLHIRNLLSVEFDEKADCPTFKRAFTEWVPDVGARMFLTEFLGYCLVPDTRYEQSVFLVGEGANGKSVFVKVVETLLGNKNCAAIPLHALKSDRTFPTLGLLGKLVNIAPETGASNVASQQGGIDENWLKMLVSGDAIDVEAKGVQNQIRMRSKARFIIHGNNPPHISDKTLGFWRKMAVIIFPNCFMGDKRDVNLFDKLQTEMSGILNLALLGLARLRKRGRFQPSELMEAAKEEYRLECNPLQNWIEDKIVKPDPDLVQTETTLAGSEAYADYRTWCRDNGHNPYSRSKFTREMKRFGHEQTFFKDQLGMTTRGFVGIDLKR